MERVDDDKWLDEALTGALGSDDTQPDFETWKAHHPEAVEKLTTQTPPAQRPPAIRSINMNGLFVKLAAAAVIAIVGIIGGKPHDTIILMSLVIFPVLLHEFPVFFITEGCGFQIFVKDEKKLELSILNLVFGGESVFQFALPQHVASQITFAVRHKAVFGENFQLPGH